MAKVRVLVQPSGLLNGEPWPEAGETLELPDAVADGMVDAELVERVKDEKPKQDEKPKTEKRPANTDKVEKRG